MSDKVTLHTSGVIKCDSLTSDDIKMYRTITTDTLSCVELNYDMILCDDPCCSSRTLGNAITI